MSGELGKDSAELAIRVRRKAFNQALANADLNSIASILAKDAVLVAGTDSAIITGRKAQLQQWKREFAAADPVTYIRLPERIEASNAAPIAFKHGKWTGTSASGQHFASGSYVAKWREVAAGWVLEAELFLTLA